MSGSEWIGLGAVVVFALLVLLLAVPLLKLGRFLDEATTAVRHGHQRPGAAPATPPGPSPGAVPAAASPEPLVDEPVIAVAEPMDVPPPHVPGEPAPLSTVVAATLGGPLIKVASLGYGVRTAARTRQESRVRAAAGRRGRDARRTTRRVA